MKVGTYNFRDKINLMVPGCPYVWLVSSAAFQKPTPGVITDLVMKRVIVLIREVPQIEKGLPVTLQVMFQSVGRIICLSQVPWINQQTEFKPYVMYELP